MPLLPGRDMSMHFFHARVGPNQIRQKSARTHYVNVLLGFVGHIVHSGVPGAQNISALFFMIGWDCNRFYKNRARIRYVELVLFHPVGSMGHLVHFGASMAQNIEELFFML
jgi:hypothetical protein